MWTWSQPGGSLQSEEDWPTKAVWVTKCLTARYTKTLPLKTISIYYLTQYLWILNLQVKSLVTVAQGPRWGCSQPSTTAAIIQRLAWLGLGGAFPSDSHTWWVSAGVCKRLQFLSNWKKGYLQHGSWLPPERVIHETGPWDTMSFMTQFLKYTIFAVSWWWNRSALCIQYGRVQYKGENTKRGRSFGAVLGAGDHRAMQVTPRLPRISNPKAVYAGRTA